MKNNKMMKILIFSLCLLLPCHTVLADFDSGRAGFSITINNEIYPYRIFATYVLPREHLGICINDPDPARVNIRSETGHLSYIDDCRWVWIAPEQPGLTTLSFSRSADNETITLNVFIMHPASDVQEEMLNGILIGSYPPPIDDSPLHQPPDGFIEVRPELLGVRVSPHFVLGQFVTPLDDKYPKYLVLRERLLLKLEALVERLNEQGFPASSLSVIAGYMTPAYGRSNGRSEYSRHIYGGAAAIIVDIDQDGFMDDLDGNGIIDNNDGQVLFNLIDELYREPGKSFLSGGLFYYRQAPEHRAYILLDARGYRKRWANENEAPKPLPDYLMPKVVEQFTRDAVGESELR